MAPDLEGFLNSVDKGRRDFLRKIIAGATFAPPLMASFSMDGPSITAAEGALVPIQCVSNQTATSLFFDFSGTEYEQNFRGILRAGDINPGLDLATNSRPSLNFTGTAGSGGSTWMTVLDLTPGTGDENPTFDDSCQLSLSLDILIHRFNNSKGAGLLALFNEGAGQKGLVLVILNAGNTDVLQLSTVDQAGKLALLKSVPLGAAIQENVWYRLTMDVVGAGPNVSVTGQVFQHVVPTNPNSTVGAQVGGTLTFSGLPSGVSTRGEVGLVARAVSALVDTSVTNFAVSGVPTP